MGIAESYKSLGRIICPLWAGFIFDLKIFYPFLTGYFVFLITLIVVMQNLRKGIVKI